MDGSHPFLTGCAIGIREIIRVVFFGIKKFSSLYSEIKKDSHYDNPLSIKLFPHIYLPYFGRWLFEDQSL